MGPTHRLAIDLGTCHTVAVVRRGDEAPRPLLFDGSPLMASGVYADEAGQLTVGKDAERLSQLAPSRFEPYPKRRVDDGSVLLGEVEVTVVDLLAALLKRVAAESLQAGVDPVGATVLTCPADWAAQRRGVLLAAARAAELGPVELVDEPIAAATYCMRVLGHQISPAQSLAVFDFGGGTLDISVVRREFSELRVLAVGGLDNLGGVDVDAALVGHLGQLIELRMPDVWRRLSKPEGAGAHRDRRALWNEIKSAKEMLSRASSAPVHVPGTEEALHLTREELDRVAGPLVDRAVDETRRVLERAGTGPGQLAGIFLVGGSSRIPLVASRLHTRFGIAPTVPEQPELPVAYGGMLAVALPPGQLPGVPLQPGGFAPGTYVAPQFGQPAQFGPFGQPGGSVTPQPTPPGGLFAGQPVSPGGAPAVPVSGVPSSPAAPAGPYAPDPPTDPAPASTTFAPIPGPPSPVTKAPVGSRKRRGLGRYVALVVVVALLATCGFGVRGVYRWAAGLTQNVPSVGDLGGGDSGDTGQALPAGAPLTKPGDGAVAVAAGAGTVYSAVARDGKTEVAAHATTGERKWITSVSMNPADLGLTLVGGLLVVDGGRDTTRNNQDTRAVLDVASGAHKWTKAWADRVDLLYLGTDTVIEVQSRPTSVQRIDLNTGEPRWTRAGENTFYAASQRRAKPALEWPKGDGRLALAPSYTKSFSGLIPFQESVGADPAVAVQLERDNKANVIDLNTGAVKVSGTVPGGRNGHWTVFAGVAVFAPSSGSDNTLVGFSLQNMAQIWQFNRSANSRIDDFRPCGERLLCVKSNISLKYSVDAVDVSTGKAQWTESVGDEPNWYVTEGRLLLGKGAFTSVDAPAIVDPATGRKQRDVGPGLRSPMAYAGSGGRVAVMSIRLAGMESVWRVSVVNVADGKVVGSADIGKDLVQYVRLSADTVVVYDEKTRKVSRFAVPAGG